MAYTPFIVQVLSVKKNCMPVTDVICMCIEFWRYKRRKPFMCLEEYQLHPSSGRQANNAS